MLRKFLDRSFRLVEKDKFKKFFPVVDALDTFCFEPTHPCSSPPFIRDSVDVKRWMIIVVFSLMPAIFMAIWNSGLQQVVYLSKNANLMQDFVLSSKTFWGAFSFAFRQGIFFKIVFKGLQLFIPLVTITYIVGGACEVLFAITRKHKIAEGLLVTGILYPLTLPPTIPYWVAALGIAFGVVFAKEVFGGTGMNVLNPALSARAFLFFAFPNCMTGDVWVGGNPIAIKDSLRIINADAHKSLFDGFSQATCLQTLNSTSPLIKRIHVDAIATNIMDASSVPTLDFIKEKFTLWSQNNPGAVLGKLSIPQLQEFLSAPLSEGGLGLLSSQFDSAYAATDLIYGTGKFASSNLFWGNILGAFGETSTFACLLGALLLIITGIASWRTILACGLGAFLTAWLFKLGSILFFDGYGAWAPAKFFIPAHRHLFMGGLAFGFIFMATDPVSSPSMKLGKWIYGAFIGFLTVFIRLINPAYPEGVMLAILLGNVFAPLFDHYAIGRYRKRAQ
ncbi:Na(+)-transporting NADH-quinone reductase subunit B [Chlamydiifrater phoenicopteri]|uniref:Na(+)-transporting NADH-quinone reductase subunit B n=1 Tax=Chlamydiifrater phoenicopteri TaxID=2681469 RepID=UPI001BD0ACE9|nr:Na(+)-transporting NADH-quinone reductase subunit B [Chlamydiifrater phoenicopteri]